MVYIGQAIDLDERYKKHMKNINDKNHQEDFYQGLREFGVTNFTYEILAQFENYDEEKLNILEKYYIDFYNSLKPNGYNMVPGGTNGAGLAKGHPVEQYDLNGVFINSFKSATEASRITGINNSSISSCCRGEIKQVRGYQWKYTSDDSKIIKPIQENELKIQRKILQYGLDKNLLNKFNSLEEASNNSGISKSLICNCCKLKNNTGGGYIWRYENNPLTSEETIKTFTKKVAQYDLQGNFIQSYNSITEAAQAVNGNIGNIQQVCAGKRKTSNKYIWKYIDIK